MRVTRNTVQHAADAEACSTTFNMHWHRIPPTVVSRGREDHLFYISVGFLLVVAAESTSE